METMNSRKSEKNILTCLNRTMQYGNFVTAGLVVNFGILFKSYYVVWKRYLTSDLGKNQKQFKSYYVVWKLTSPFELSSHLPTFKSYYVVWKHKKYANAAPTPASLNRTMQYGNKVFRVRNGSMYSSLNRTMQYGNFFSILPIILL